MATTAKFRKIQQIESAAVTEAYEAGASVTTSFSQIRFTNTVNTPLVIDIYHNDGTNNLLLDTVGLPAGSGQKRVIYDLERSVFAAGDKLEIVPSGATAFNMFIYGSETSA